MAGVTWKRVPRRWAVSAEIARVPLRMALSIRTSDFKAKAGVRGVWGHPACGPRVSPLELPLRWGRPNAGAAEQGGLGG